MRANYEIIDHDKDKVILRDLGPWDEFMTITNAAEQVVENLAEIVGNRRLFYYDSEGDYGELVHKDGRFVGFAFAERV